MGLHCRWIPFAVVPLEGTASMTSRRFLSLAAACVIGTMALAVPTLPVQAAPTSASTIVAVASVAPQTDAVSVSPAPASSHNVLAPTGVAGLHRGDCNRTLPPTEVPLGLSMARSPPPTTAGFLPERKRCPTSRTAVAHRRCQTPATGMGALPASRDTVRPSRADRATASTRPPIARLRPSPGPPETDGNTMRACRTTPA